MDDYKDKLWCDLETDGEKIEFLKCGRALETGILAQAIIPEIIELLESRISFKKLAENFAYYQDLNQL